MEKYLKEKGVASIDMLTDEDVIYFFENRAGINSKMSAKIAHERVKAGTFTNEEVVRSMRKALEKKKQFICGYVVNESCDGYKFARHGWILEP